MKNRDVELSNLLTLIAEVKSEDDIPDFAKILYEDVYDSDSFRHSYANISSTLYDLVNESQTGKDDPIIVVSVTLDEIIRFCAKTIPYKDDVAFLEKLRKLKDHVDLQYLQMNSIFSLNADADRVRGEFAEKTEAFKKEFEESIKTSGEQFEQLKGKFLESQKKLDAFESSIFSQIIAVLGIFVAIVVACFGTMEILGNVSGLLAEHIPLYKVLVAFFVMALAFMDILALLIYFIGRLCGKPISAPCKYGSCDKCERKKGKCNGWGHFIHSQYHLIITNGALVVMIVLTIILLPGVERNIDKKYYTETTVIAEETREPETETEWATEFQTEPTDTSTQTE
jgi:hypothetical protein